MLIYCLISSFINVPIFLMGYYLVIFEHSHRLCQYYEINAASINIGMVTCLAYASIERHYLIFRKNGLFSWRRQFIPIICIILYSYAMSMLIVFIPQCTYTPCSSCHAKNLKLMLVWLTFSFIIPELIMFISTMLLIYRLYQQRVSYNRSKEGNIYYRIVTQMTLYVLWSCLYYCPPTFYNLSLIIDPDRVSPPTRSAMIIVSTVSVQSYPILTFILMINYHRKTKTKKPSPPNDSALKLNVIPTISEPPGGQSF